MKHRLAASVMKIQSIAVIGYKLIKRNIVSNLNECDLRYCLRSAEGLSFAVVGIAYPDGAGRRNLPPIMFSAFCTDDFPAERIGFF